MELNKCAVKNCENKGFIAYGNNWICGECMMRIINKEKEKQNKQIEDLGND